MRTLIYVIVALISTSNAYSQSAETYYAAGFAKGNLQDYIGAIVDYNRAIEFNPNFAEAYYNRGIAKLLLSQKESGCLDLSKAGKLGYISYETISKYCD